MDITSLIIQLVSGLVGGNAAGKTMPNFDLGALGNTIAGAIGGVGGGQLLQALIPAMAAGATGGGLDIGSIIGQLAGGGAGGAVLTIIVALLKNMMAGQQKV